MSHSNRLAFETSPYLLQHAHNPVDWYPWGPEALGRAAAEDKPILLSVGYSACHWCHVMERESFEQDEIAALMNQDFVCIKVDREERPDIDEIYMGAVQAFTGGHGGWPMTVFITPDGQPFFGGTYFPPKRSRGMPGFDEVLGHAARLWREERQQIGTVTAELLDHLSRKGRLPAPAGDPETDWLAVVAEEMAKDFDSKNAGFGKAPKFPPHGTLAALLAHHARSGDARTLRILTRTLDAMAKGGMYDLAGGGFARYSVDAEWRIPHFEKMLYDNAQLVPVYLDAWRATGKPLYRRVVEDTLDYLLREMCWPEGGFCAAQDADSEGVEGRYYCWTPAELRAVLGLQQGLRAAVLLEVTEEGTFEHGSSVLRLEEPLETLPAEDQELLRLALPTLYTARQQRVPPARDDKVITAWNALAISAFARASATFGRLDYVAAARRAADFLLQELVVDGRLQRTWKGGRAHLLAYADDHALLILALLDLWEADFDPRWLAEANRLADQTVALFWDEEGSGLFYTGTDAEALITRSKHMLGGAEPSANGAAALAFARLGLLCGRDDLALKADRILAAYRPLLDRAPRALGLETLAAAWRQGPTRELAVVASHADPVGDALIACARAPYLPFLVLARVPPFTETPPLLPWLEGRGAVEASTAWLCEGHSCQAPTSDPEALAAALQPGPSPRRRVIGRDRAAALPADPASWRNSETPLSLADLRGQVVLLDFFTYCCINCLHVLPELAALEARFAGRPVAVIGVHSAKFTTEKVGDQVERALSRHGIRHPVALDPTHKLWEEYAISGWPTVVALDMMCDEFIHQCLLEEAGAEAVAGSGQLAPTPGPTGRLRHPGKVAVWPDPPAQERGADPFGPEARLYIGDTSHHQVHELALSRDVDGWPTARLLRSFGSGSPGLQDGRGARIRLREPQGIARSGEGLWVADTGNHALRRIDLGTGEIRTMAGTGELGRGGGFDPVAPLRTALRSPWDLAVAPGAEATGDLIFIAMAGSHQIWVYVEGEDRLQPFAGSGKEDHTDGPAAEAALAQPSGIALHGRYAFIADSEVSSIRALDLQAHRVGTVVGAGLFDFGDIDGPGGQARLQHPLGISAAGRALYVADTYNHKIKRISLDDATVATLAGGAGLLDEPGGLCRVGDFLVVADTNHHRLVVVHRHTGELRPLAIDEGPA